MATTTGGAVAGSTPTAPAHHAPITAKTSNIAYSGPVYEKTTTGQLVPYTQAPTTAPAQTGSATASSTTGGSTVSDATGGSPVTRTSTTKPELLVPGHVAHIIDGLAAAPVDAPLAVQEIIWAGNQIVGLPYIYGGGHASFISPGYDCSGTVSYALHGASLLSSPMDSTEFEGWGGGGVGAWVTIFANGGHAYMTVAGIRLDTSPANDPSNLPGPRWRPLRPENAGFVVRHPVGL
jgi:cell wall-associated NlpC family hydrolase